MSQLTSFFFLIISILRIYRKVKSAHLASGAVSHVVAARRAVVSVDPLESRADVRWALVNRLAFHQFAYGVVHTMLQTKNREQSKKLHFQQTQMMSIV